MNHVDAFERLPKSIKKIHVGTSIMLRRLFKIRNINHLFIITTLLWIVIILLVSLKIFMFLKIEGIA